MGLLVHQFIEGKLITDWKNWENKYVESVPMESNFKTDINFIFCLTSSTDKYCYQKVITATNNIILIFTVFKS